MKHTRCSELDPFTGDDQCANFELVGKGAAIERSSYSVAKTVVPPHTNATRHYHAYTEELYIVTGGTGLIVVDDVTMEVSVGDTVLIEHNERHFAVSNTDSGLEFLAISFPAYDKEDFITEQ
ncbi:MAG: cupin domain-containing protein [Pseudomonadales bacterium]